MQAEAAAFAGGPRGSHVGRALRGVTSSAAAPTSSGSYDASWMHAGQNRPIVVVDIDETLSITDYNSVLMGVGGDDSQPLPFAREGMRRLAANFDIIYLTARPQSSANATQRWLRSHGFPEGPLFTAPNVGDFLLQTSFKRQALAKIRSHWPQLLIGIGDKPTDADAYRSNGMLALVVNPWRDRTYRDDELIFRDWSSLDAFFQKNHATLSHTEKLRRAVVTKQFNGSTVATTAR